MRDAGKVKNKLEVRLDANQVFFLFAGLATWTALAFVVGVVVGRGKHAVDATPVATVALPDATPTAATRIEDRLAAAQPKATEEPEIPIGDVMSHLETASPGNAVAGSHATPKPTAKATPKPAATATAEAKVTPKPAASPTAVAKGAFTLQVVAYNDEAQADSAVAALKAKHLEAYAVTAEIPGKGTIHRVRVGHFASRDAAESQASTVAAALPGTKPMVVPVD